MHADVHEQVLHEYLVINGIDPKPMLDQVEYAFEKVLAPTTSTDPRRLNHLCDRLWVIAAIEHYTAVLGDFALNCAWDDHNADPTMVDLFRWHGSEEVEHRMVAHDVAVYFHDSYVDRIRAMTMSVVMILVFFQRAAWYLVKTDHTTDNGCGKSKRVTLHPPQLDLLHSYRQLFGSNTAMYVKPGFAP
jgi:predicted metal-dependent hydrolase